MDDQKEHSISIIIPCYNEEESIRIFYEEIVKVLTPVTECYELIFIDDGSKDRTLEEIRSICESNDRVIYLSFSRNFGKEAAMYAGLCNARGQYTAVMDVDLQDPPELLPEMLGYLTQGTYDCVATRRADRKGEPPVRSWFAKQFYRIINKFSDADIVDGARDFRLMNRKVVDAIIRMGEYNRFSKGIFGWVGFRTKWISFENRKRAAGKTKWNFWKLFKYAMDGIISFSQVPLSIAAWLGFLMTIVALFFVVFIVVRKLLFGDPVTGWASTACIIIFIGGIQMASLGVIGQYLAKTYLESKHRPHYIISETNRQDIELIG